MYGSPPSKDLNLPHPAAGPFGGRRAEDPEPDLRRHHQQEQMSSGLLRYQSAPSSLLGEVSAGEDFAPDRGSSPETETMFARFLAPDLRNDRDKVSGGSTAPGHGGPHFPPPPSEINGRQSGGFPSAPQIMFHPQPQQQMPSRTSVETSFPAAVGSLAMETDQIKNPSASSNLIRQSSSPAGLFPHLTMDNGYGMMRGFMVEGACRSKGQLSFSSRQSSVMSQISEMENEEMEGNSIKEEDGNGSRRGRTYISGFPVSSWDDSSLFNNSFLGLKAGRDGLSSLEPPQNGEVRNHALGLPHHLSLPTKNSLPPAMTSIDKFLQFHDAVPCKIRAKRGCATHPRSIAERVRRTRISERMKKLQDLVPNMDKQHQQQTNTADMLDLAVDYIKDLQKRVKSLSEGRASCSCSATRQKPY